MMTFGKTIIFIGVILVLVGSLMLILGKISPIGRLPGDILIKKGNFTFYFPLATCVVLSLLFSLIMFFISRK